MRGEGRGGVSYGEYGVADFAAGGEVCDCFCVGEWWKSDWEEVLLLLVE